MYVSIVYSFDPKTKDDQWDLPQNTQIKDLTFLKKKNFQRCHTGWRLGKKNTPKKFVIFIYLIN